MALSPKSTTKEVVKAVLTVLISVTVLGLFIIFLGGHRFWEDLDEYSILFDSVKDLSRGRPVKFSGMDVGRVMSIQVDPDNPAKIKVVIGVEKGFTLYQGTKATISQKGLVGDKYVYLTLSPPVGPRLEPGSVIPQEETLSLNDAAERIGKLVDSVGPQIKRVADGLSRLFEKENIDRIQDIIASLERFVADADQAVNTLNREITLISEETKRGLNRGVAAIEKVGGQASTTLAAADRTLASIERNLGDVSRELETAIQSVSSNANNTISQVDGLATDLRRDWGYDQERLAIILDGVDQLIRDVRKLARSLEERPWRLIYTPEGEPVP